MKAMQSDRVVGYVRVSGDSQHGGDQDGKPRQLRAIEKYCKKNKLTLTEMIEDLGVSGTLALAERPGLSRLLNSLIPPGLLLIEKADRLARDLIAGELIIRHLADAGWKIIAVETGEDLTQSQSPTSILLRQLQGAIAEFDRRNIVARLRAARDRKREQKGRCEGRKPFADQKALDRLKALSRKRGGKRPTLQSIADAMNNEGFLTATGKPWTRGLVGHFLAD